MASRVYWGQVGHYLQERDGSPRLGMLLRRPLETFYVDPLDFFLFKLLSLVA